ncbi:MAG: hypothetical protein L3J58_03885 [Emcibacter sp.]|nr:hypothetical protein [Emcibacter sp.]
MKQTIKAVMIGGMLFGTAAFGSDAALAHSEKHNQKHYNRHDNDHNRYNYNNNRGHEHAYGRKHKRAHKYYRKHEHYRGHDIRYWPHKSHKRMARRYDMSPAFYITPHGTVVYLIPDDRYSHHGKRRHHKGHGWR